MKGNRLAGMTDYEHNGSLWGGAKVFDEIALMTDFAHNKRTFPL
jgi:hypothetical protein